MGRFLHSALCILMVLIASPAPAGAAAPVSLKVLTLNAWLLRVFGHEIGKDIEERLTLIPSEVAKTGVDLIALQEVWTNRHKDQLANEFRKLGYPYSVYKRRNIGMGNGLMLVSKYPLINFRVAPIFRHHTRLDEMVVAKRAIYAGVQISKSLTIDFFTIHVGALTYDVDTGNYNRRQKARQREQYLEFKAWFKQNRKNPISIVAGDFNADYRTLSGGRFLKNFADDYLELKDQACGDQEDFLNHFLTANRLDAKSDAVPTFSRENAYVRTGLFSEAPSETEDYIYSCGLTPEHVLESAVIFQDTPHLSDHYGVMSHFAL